MEKKNEFLKEAKQYYKKLLFTFEAKGSMETMLHKDFSGVWPGLPAVSYSGLRGERFLITEIFDTVMTPSEYQLNLKPSIAQSRTNTTQQNDPGKRLN
ncbi:unnamed protein product [Ceratitis capitata]|uniref:(Mediterranean fruit fly) hypothetical protein n=1 Tax=Ceratitis capitata TaxID=7213 RepID=A0A811VCZ8_CERCA|nr:unnamed protein product [Ceratitis capitata]